MKFKFNMSFISSTGHQEDVWRYGSVTVASVNPYSLVFEAEVGTYTLGTMAIYDVDFVEDEKCPREGKQIFPQ
jgi:hypothetical protein